MSMAGSLGSSMAGGYGGAGGLVRQVWLDQYAPAFHDMWEYEVLSITTALSVGGGSTIDLATIDGPDPESGNIRFQLGTYLPRGTKVRIRYSGGYATTPADLADANRHLTAWLIVSELGPLGSGLNPDALHAKALDILYGYTRSGPPALKHRKLPMS
jgi:hypothetical protein